MKWHKSKKNAAVILITYNLIFKYIYVIFIMIYYIIVYIIFMIILNLLYKNIYYKLYSIQQYFIYIIIFYLYSINIYIIKVPNILEEQSVFCSLNKRNMIFLETEYKRTKLSLLFKHRINQSHCQKSITHTKIIEIFPLKQFESIFFS